MVEFMERYGLNDLPPEANGQHEQMMAYIQARKDGFPIELDLSCELFQSMAFAEQEDFCIKEPLRPIEDNKKYSKYLFNTITKNIPAVLHFNGLTDMSILKELK
jgi:hypothetical protein